MHPDYSGWLADREYAEGTQTAQIHRVKKVEECYGDLLEHLKNGTFQDVIRSLEYTAADERANKPNPSKIDFNGNIRNNLQSYKNAALRYKNFLLEENTEQTPTIHPAIADTSNTDGHEKTDTQKFALERDMQATLRRNIASLDPALKIIDDGAERSVDSGFIDITCEDDQGIVVIELKAGKADSRAIGQILGYMGDIQEEEDNKPVRGILVAHDFDKRAKAAARVVPSLTLKSYEIEFTFHTET